MAQFEFEAGVNDCLKKLEAPLSRGPVPRWQRKERERNLCSSGKPLSPLQTSSRSRGRSSTSSKAQTYTPGKKAKTPCKSPKKTPLKSPKKFGLSPRGDRFIPSRPLTDCEWSHFQIMQGSEGTDTSAGDMELEATPEFQATMAENLGNNPSNSKILHFKSGAPVTKEDYQERDETNKQRIQELEEELSGEKLRSARLKEKIKEQADELESYQDQEASSLPCYEMAKRPRGMCVIINNIIFEGLAKREGTELDEKALKQLFRDLFFKVHVFKDLHRNQMLNVAVNYAKKDHSEFDAFVFIVMSHGGDGDTIYGVKGRSTGVEDLMHEFKAANCQTLRNKPKLFFIQTCRGSSDETLSPALGDADVNSATVFSGDSTLPRGVCPQEVDFLLAFATAPGYKAWRNREAGSLFIQTLVEAIREHHNNHHLLDILTEVNRRVAAREENQRVPVQVPAPTHTLRGQLYL